MFGGWCGIAEKIAHYKESDMIKQVITYYCYSCNTKTGCVKVVDKLHNQFDCESCSNVDGCNSDGNIIMTNFTHKCEVPNGTTAQLEPVRF